MNKTRQILVMSDTHGQISSIHNILMHHSEITDIFHSGDSELNSNDPLLANIHIVRGNCDYDHNFSNELIIPIDNHIIYITHGHLHGVKSSLNKLAEHAQQHNADIALYGHTHIAKVDNINNILCINPGSIAYPRSNLGSSYAIILIHQNSIKVHFYNLQHSQIAWSEH